MLKLFTLVPWFVLAAADGANAEFERIPLPAEYRTNLVYVVPETAAGERIDFYTDTGGGFNAIRRSVAERLQLAPMETGTAGELVAFPEFAAGSRMPAPLEEASLRGGLAVVEDSELKSAGFLGGKWFADRVWEFDYGTQTLALLEGWSPAAGSDHGLELGFQTNAQGARTMHFPRMSVEVEGHQLEVLLDTGARFELTAEAAAQFGVPEGSWTGGSFIIESVFVRWREAHPDWEVIESGDRVGDRTAPMIRVPVLQIAGHAVGPVWFSVRPDAAFKEYMSSMMDAPIVGAVGGSAFQYLRMVIDYPDARAHFFSSAVTGIPLDNPSFEQSGRSGLPAGWETAVADESALAPDSGTAVDGSASLHARLLGEPVMLRQALDAEALRERQLRLRGAIRTEELDGQAVLFVMVNGGGQRLFMDDMRRRAVRGSTDWAHYEITVPPLPTAEQIVVGVLALGQGQAWFDDLSLTAITPSGEISGEALTYLNGVLDLMQEKALLRNRTDWPALRENVLAAADGARTPEETHAAIQYAITLLGDPHTSFAAAPQTSGPEALSADPGPVPQIEAELLDSRFGYLNIPGFSNHFNAAARSTFVDHAQDRIRRLANQGACGWIIDLRGGAGGSMWPALAGLGPLLDTVDVGACVEADGEQGSWWYRNGQAGSGDQINASATGASVQLLASDPVVALLTSRATASAGEALALVFSGQANARRFGETTAGLATSNAVQQLPDGSQLVLTLCAMEDRNGQHFPEGIPPDVETTAAEAQEQALAWLAQTPSCQQ